MDETRSVDLSVDVPGTPDEVWETIATGPGLSVWFVPTDIEGDTVTMHHGMLDQVGRITAWEPPQRWALALGEFSPPGTDAPPLELALEIVVEARSGDRCVVRLVNSGFGGGGDWDRQFESSSVGWERCLEILRLYLTHFRGQPHAAAHAATESSLEPVSLFGNDAAAVAARVEPEWQAWLASSGR